MAVRLYVGQRDVPVKKKDRESGLFVYKMNFFRASSTPSERSAVQI